MYFDELYSVVINNLKNAKKEVCIAVAWINFDLYEHYFNSLLKNKVELKIIVNDDFINSKFDNQIQALESNGAKIKKVKMPNYTNRMHHKFCLIDNQTVLTGSYNWSKNAATNFENLVVIDDSFCGMQVKKEFEYIWDTPQEELKKLQKVEYCKVCKEVLLNIMVVKFNIDKHGQAEYKLVNYCQCDDYKVSANDYLTPGFETTLNGIIDNYEDLKLNYPEEEDQIELELEESIQNLLTNVFDDEKIDAIGIIREDVLPFTYEMTYTTSILWKKRFKSRLINEAYDETFGLI